MKRFGPESRTANESQVIRAETQVRSLELDKLKLKLAGFKFNLLIVCRILASIILVSF